MNLIKKIFDGFRHNYYELAKWLAFVLATIIVFALMPREGKFKYEYFMSKPWQHETLYAPFDFPIYKSNEVYLAECENAAKSVAPIFSFDESEIFATGNVLVSNFESQWDDKQDFDKDQTLQCLLKVFDSIESQGIVAYDKAVEELTAENPVLVIRNNKLRKVRYGDFYNLNSAMEAAEGMIGTAADDVDVEMVNSLLKSALRQSVFYDAALTQKEREKAIEAVMPTSGMVQRDELIISEGEVVNERNFAILNSLQREYAQHSFSQKDSVLMWVSQLFFVALLFFMMGIYIKKMHKKVFAELRNINVLLFLVILVVVPCYLIVKLNPAFILIVPVSVLTVLVGSFFSLPLAFGVQVFAIMLISIVVPNPFQYIFMQLVVTLVTIFSMSDHLSRRKFFQTAILVFVSYIVVYIAFTMLTASEINWFNVALLALNALFTMLAQPVIIAFEKLFGFTTSLTLMELCNTNNPLLRRLSNEAPGTFQHSTQVANLAEEVLIAIGGDSILARTGAMYHDVGKLTNPMYFTENQHGAYSPHDDLSNVESAQIIISHVTDGIELARKAQLPEQIIDFIRTHHGTRQTDFFLGKERKLRPEEEIDLSDFTYHGPEPFSRETAVLMICDSVEAASHSLKEPDELKINTLVDNIINKQIEAGQFKNTDLTLRDFEIIRNVLKKKIQNIYHVRIAYPDK